MGAKRTRRAGRVSVVAESVARRHRFFEHARDLFAGLRYQRLAIHGSPHHAGTEAISFVRISSRRAVDILPKTADVLYELAQHEVSAVASEISPCRVIFRREQFTGSCGFGIEQRAVG